MYRWLPWRINTLTPSSTDHSTRRNSGDAGLIENADCSDQADRIADQEGAVLQTKPLVAPAMLREKNRAGVGSEIKNKEQRSAICPDQAAVRT
uniref:Uncharacterized protein n=1 Tax=Fagus sylvatica TaxID=28930 RepID=A0A2N9I3N3_FAGSY